MPIVAAGTHDPLAYFAGRMKYLGDAAIVTVLQDLLAGKAVLSPSGAVTIDALPTLEEGLVQLRLFRPNAPFAATIMVRSLDPAAVAPGCWMLVGAAGVRWRLADCDLTALKTARQV